MILWLRNWWKEGGGEEGSTGLLEGRLGIPKDCYWPSLWCKSQDFVVLLESTKEIEIWGKSFLLFSGLAWPQ